MSRIRILSDQVANQIAAGEVIERPASAVKELVENALDAGATRIEVAVRRGGRALLSVEDNGQGMDRDDAVLAFRRHATSKLAAAADLERIGTFGFRGEALPSIASIARCTVRTRTAASDAGTELRLDAGKVEFVRDCGCPVGTRIEVEHLFHSVPARRKFLKSDRTESGHIAHCVRLYALAAPHVAFSLVEDDRVVFRSPACTGLDERVAEIFGPQLAEALAPIEAAEGTLRLRGLMGRPGFDRGSRHETLVFVNGRPVDSRTIGFAIAEAYRGTMAPGRHPPAFLFFECPTAAVDVNVHPAKREVRFRDEAAVRSFVVRSLLSRLRELAPGAPPAAAPAPYFPAPPAAVPELREPAAPFPAPALALGAGAAPEPRAVLAGWRVLGLVHRDYAAYETPAGLVLIDRRAAHERIWFERLQARLGRGETASQRLLLPLSLELDPVGSALLLDRKRFLAAAGFEVAEFGRHFFRIEAVPDWMEPADAEAFLRDVIGALRDGSLGSEDSAAAREQFARLAAARGIRLPAQAGEAELLALASQLLATRSPLASPAGRPTLVEFGLGELARRFGR